MRLPIFFDAVSNAFFSNTLAFLLVLKLILQWIIFDFVGDDVGVQALERFQESIWYHGHNWKMISLFDLSGPFLGTNFIEHPKFVSIALISTLILMAGNTRWNSVAWIWVATALSLWKFAWFIAWAADSTVIDGFNFTFNNTAYAVLNSTASSVANTSTCVASNASWPFNIPTANGLPFPVTELQNTIRIYQPSSPCQNPIVLTCNQSSFIPFHICTWFAVLQFVISVFFVMILIEEYRPAFKASRQKWQKRWFSRMRRYFEDCTHRLQLNWRRFKRFMWCDDHDDRVSIHGSQSDSLKRRLLSDDPHGVDKLHSSTTTRDGDIFMSGEIMSASLSDAFQLF